MISQIVGERPAHEGASAFGCTQPHTLERSTAKTMSDRPVADRIAPT